MNQYTRHCANQLHPNPAVHNHLWSKSLYRHAYTIQNLESPIKRYIAGPKNPTAGLNLGSDKSGANNGNNKNNDNSQGRLTVARRHKSSTVILTHPAHTRAGQRLTSPHKPGTEPSKVNKSRPHSAQSRLGTSSSSTLTTTNQNAGSGNVTSGLGSACASTFPKYSVSSEYNKRTVPDRSPAKRLPAKRLQLLKKKMCTSSSS